MNVLATSTKIIKKEKITNFNVSHTNFKVSGSVSVSLVTKMPVHVIYLTFQVNKTLIHDRFVMTLILQFTDYNF
jgi:hypothetical protein